MIGKLIRGRSLRGLLDYLLAPEDQKGDRRPRVAIVGGTFAGQPFAVAEIRPNVFEASIRLVPWSDPEPSPKVHRMAAAIAAKTVGGQASETILLPGFFSPVARRTKRRRALVTLRMAARVVAELGAELLQSARQQLEKIARKQHSARTEEDLLPPGQKAMVDTARPSPDLSPEPALAQGQAVNRSRQPLAVDPTEVHFEDFGL